MTVFLRTFQTVLQTRWFWLGVGLMIRLIIIVNSGWHIDFDEAFNGILAQRILQGKWVLFTPPEVVGGTGTPYILAMIFSVFGSSAITFRIISLLWSAVYILSVEWLARLAYGKKVGLLALGLVACAPPYMQFVGMKLWSSYIETLLLGNGLLICTYYLLQAETPRRRLYLMTVCGLISGVMFWLTWLGFAYYFAVGVILLWRGRRILWQWGWSGIVGFMIGSLPFWIFNIPRGMPTLQRVLADTPMTLEQIGRVLADVITSRFPILVTGHPTWGYQADGVMLVVALVYGLGLLYLIRMAHTKQPLSVMLAILCLSVPLLYSISTHSRNALPEFNPWGIDATGRYLLMWHSVLPIGVAVLIQAIWQRKKQVAIGLYIGMLLINTIGTLTVNPIRAFDSPYYDRLPDDLTPLITFLDEHDIRYAWADGGIGHVLMFLTEGRILTEDYHAVFLAGGLVRQPDVLEQVQSANPTVFITPIYAGQQNPPLQQALDQQQIPYEMIRVTPEIAVYMLDEQINPQEVASGLGYQY